MAQPAMRGGLLRAGHPHTQQQWAQLVDGCLASLACRLCNLPAVVSILDALHASRAAWRGALLSLLQNASSEAGVTLHPTSSALAATTFLLQTLLECMYAACTFVSEFRHLLGRWLAAGGWPTFVLGDAWLPAAPPYVEVLGPRTVGAGRFRTRLYPLTSQIPDSYIPAASHR